MCIRDRSRGRLSQFFFFHKGNPFAPASMSSSVKRNSTPAKWFFSAGGELLQRCVWGGSSGRGRSRRGGVFRRLRRTSPWEKPWGEFFSPVSYTHLDVYKRQQQLGAQIAHNDIDMVIFLRDPLTGKPHEPDPASIIRLCDTHNIPIATNLEMCIRDREKERAGVRTIYRPDSRFPLFSYRGFYRPSVLLHRTPERVFQQRLLQGKLYFAAIFAGSRGLAL